MSYGTGLADEPGWVSRLVEMAVAYRKAWEAERKADDERWECPHGDPREADLILGLVKAEAAASQARQDLLRHIRMRPGKP